VDGKAAVHVEGEGVPSEAGKTMGRTRSSVEDLRLAIDCLPLRTREAMLAGIRSHEIIVGAYSDRAGGVCPMLAAHRCGGRTSFVSFARAWDRFTHAKRARAATGRELSALEAHLHASILSERGDADLGGAIAAHQTLVRERKAGEARRLGLGWLHRRDGARDEELV
jgi:hypothetical protein